MRAQVWVAAPRRELLLLASLTLLAGCAGTRQPSTWPPRVGTPAPAQPAAKPAARPADAPPASSPPTPGAAPAAPPAAAADGLAAERRWLRQWFDGTPVRIEQPAEGQLRVAVPREFCFEGGKARIKPPLAAVLAKLAESLRRQPQAQLALVSTPDDDNRSKALGAERAAQVRRALNERGVPVGRLGGDSAVQGDTLQLHITLPQG
jgi:outer membrane protein OmpA-like peptidoglycan-associated protein